MHIFRPYTLGLTRKPGQNAQDYIDELNCNNLIVPIIKDSIAKAIFTDNELFNLISFVIGTTIRMELERVNNSLCFNNAELLKRHFTDKVMYADLVAYADGFMVNIEFQSSESTSSRLKNLGYHHRLASRFPQTMQIVFSTDSKYGDDVVTEFGMVDLKEGKYNAGPYYRKYYVSLANAYKLYYNDREKADKFIKFLTLMTISDKDELKRIAMGDEELMLMVDKAIKFSNDTEVIDEYFLEELHTRCMNAEREEGEIIGTKKRNIEIARNMLNENESIDKIKLYTGLTESDINSLVEDGK